MGGGRPRTNRLRQSRDRKTGANAPETAAKKKQRRPRRPDMQKRQSRRTERRVVQFNPLRLFNEKSGRVQRGVPPPPFPWRRCTSRARSPVWSWGGRGWLSATGWPAPLHLPLSLPPCRFHSHQTQRREEGYFHY